MPGLKIFFAWFLTVVIGSLLLPFGIVILNGHDLVSGDLGLGLLFVLVAIILSGLCSLPTLIALLIVNDVNNHKPVKVQFRYVNMTHLIMLMLTLVGGNLWLSLYSDDSYDSEFSMKIIREDMLALSSVILLYAIVAVPIWILFFRKLWMKSREEETREGSADGQA